MKLPTKAEVSHAVQVLCAIAGVDPDTEQVQSVSIDADGRVTVRRLLVGINHVPILEADGQSLKMIETTYKDTARAAALEFPAPNPYMPPVRDRLLGGPRP